MFDTSHLPNAINGADVQVFRAPGQWQTWVKPRGKSMVSIYALGSGGGGGGGFSSAAATARGGGGGGGSGAMARVLLPASVLPDVLYCFVASGGLGGAASVAGAVGNVSYVNLFPEILNTYTRVLVTGGAGAGGGGAGSLTAGGVAGAAAGAGAFYPLTHTGVATSIVGLAGAVGGAHTGAAGGNISGVAMVHGGAGGGGTTSADFAGGSFSGAYWMPSLNGGAAIGGRGQDGLDMSPGGVWTQTSSVAAPGTGGGSNNAATGGDGGNGGSGCGGGGGGAGLTGGRGGNGGHGLIVVLSW